MTRVLMFLLLVGVLMFGSMGVAAAAPNIEMVLVKGGCFQMGDTFGDLDSLEKPVHQVCVGDFYIGKYEVTQGQWQAVMGNNPSSFKDCGANCPVEDVSWSDSMEFIEALSKTTGKKYRLPTEAEWEYAARSGGRSEKYSGGNAVDTVAWYDNNSGGKTHPVGQKKPNGLGLYDMSGNVWEWVSDWFDSEYYSKSPRDNPRGPGTGSTHVLRGGAWNDDSGYARASYRSSGSPGYRYSSYLGFRCARTP